MRTPQTRVVWTCDNCHDEERVDHDGAPDGWIDGVQDLESDHGTFIVHGDYCGAECLAAAVKGAAD